MKLDIEIAHDFQEAVDPVIKWLNEHGNPHMKIEITQTSAEILSAEYMRRTDAYVKD